MPSTANGVTHRSEQPEGQSDQEHDYADCPHNRNSRNETDEEKYQSENNHNASIVRVPFKYQ